MHVCHATREGEEGDMLGKQKTLFDVPSTENLRASSKVQYDIIQHFCM